TDSVQRSAIDISRRADYAPFVGEAASMAAAQGLDFVDLVAADGTIVSSAEWPARFGYRLPWVTGTRKATGAFLQTIELPRGTALGLVAVAQVPSGAKAIFVAGGRRLDEQFL